MIERQDDMDGAPSQISHLRSFWTGLTLLVVSVMLLDTVLIVYIWGNSNQNLNVEAVALAFLLADSTVAVPFLLVLTRRVESFDDLFMGTRIGRGVMNVEYLLLIATDLLTIGGSAVAGYFWLQGDTQLALIVAIGAIALNVTMRLFILAANYLIIAPLS